MTGRAVTAVGALTLGLVAGVIAIAATSTHEESIGASLVLAIPIGLAFVVSGVIARVQRPDNRTGTLLLLVGLTWFLNGISGANDPYLFTVGITLSAVTLGFLAHLLLAFPSGRLDTRRQRVLAAAGYVLAFAANPIILLFSDPHESCANCPRNVMLVHHDQGLARALDIATAVLAVLLVTGIAAVLVQRWRTATTAYRRAVAPVLIAGGAMLVLLAANLVYDAGRTQPGQTPLGWALMVALLGVPLSFLLGLLRTRLARDAVTRLLAEAPEASTPAQTEAALRRALGDPGLELGFWLPERSVYVGASGAPLEPNADDPRVVTHLDDTQGEPLAAVAHDAALLEERELLDGALAAARLAIQKDRLQAEASARMAELKRERDFTRAVVDSAPAFFCVLDPNGRIERYNRALENASGIADDEHVRGRAFWEVFPTPPERDAVRTAIELRDRAQHESRWIGADGSDCVVIWRVTDLPGDLLLVSGGDISARKRAEEQMLEHVALLSAMGDATPSLLVLIEDAGVLTEDPANATYRDLTGFTIRDLARTVFWETVAAPDTAEEAERIVRSVLEGGACGLQESRWVKKDGSEFLCEWTCTKLPPFGGRRLVLIAGVDVTERKRQEDELRRSRARLVSAADEERRRLERNLHDGAQQRLVSVSLSLRLAQGKLNEAANPGVGAALDSASYELSTALEELRELARGLHPAVLSDRGLAAALRGVVDRAQIPGAELDVQVEGRLDEQVEVALFYVAAESLTNIAKYAQATAVNVRLHHTSNEAVVEIADNGIGGATFEGGSGLRGLRDRVESLDGTLQIVSEPGQGTIIRVAIPCTARVPA
jgi:PAS domain S-box-containing protein